MKGRFFAVTSLCASLIIAAGAAYGDRPRAKPARDVAPTVALLKRAADTEFQDLAGEIANLDTPIAQDLALRTALLHAPTRYWRERLDLARRRPDWPGAGNLRIRAEYGARNAEAEDVLAAFERDHPATAAGAHALVEALLETRRTARARAVARRAWRDVAFRSTDERRFLALCGDLLRQSDHEARLARLFWEGERRGARRQMRRVDNVSESDRVRLAFMERRASAPESYAALSGRDRRDAGLEFERARYLRRADRNEEAAEALILAERHLNGPPPAPRRWRAERDILARRLIKDGRDARAYAVIAGHGLERGYDFAEAEFLAGWLALRRLDDAEAAAAHFARLEAGVRYAVSLAKAAYWRGRAADAMGDAQTALGHYRRAASRPDTFYGGLAADIVGAEPTFGAEGDWAGEDTGDTGADEALFVMTALLRGGQARTALLFADWAVARGLPDGRVRALAEEARALGHPQVAVRLAKAAARLGGDVGRVGAPIPPQVIAAATAKLDDPALLLAHARQESEFDADAVSPAGARGLMQFVPGTARVTARRAGMRYLRGRLTGDPAYAAQLGAAHIDDLLERYDGAYALTIAAYNAGTTPVNRWIRDYGDPRAGDVDPLDWVELIPYSETRSYVHRVFENLRVYRARLGGPAVDVAGALRGAETIAAERAASPKTGDAGGRADGR